LVDGQNASLTGIQVVSNDLPWHFRRSPKGAIMRMRKLISSVALATAVVAGSALVSNSASATSITVVNPSFEAPVTFTNGDATGLWEPGSIPGWSIAGYTGEQVPGVGLFNYLPDGLQFAFTNGGSISQTVSTAAVAGTTYTLQVDVGNRTDGYNGNVAVELITGAVTTLANGTYAGPLNTYPNGGGTGNWSIWTAVYTPTVADLLSGNLITIDLINTAGPQGAFDNVQLTATPLPSTWTMLIAGFVGLGFFAYRGTKKNAAAIAAA
jgi:hypothetical protein